MSQTPFPEPLTPEHLARLAQAKAIRRRRRKPPPPCATPLPQPFVAVSASQQSGHAAEELACHYLTEQGLFVLARNLKCRTGEIDIVARDQNVLVFIEVRSRRNVNYGLAAETVGPHKQKRLVRTAHFWLPYIVRRHFIKTPICRFDIITLNSKTIRWIQDAFRTV
ncbi:MAG: YraN family protein [Pusillimonas sp.]|nr:YraN family protein [Pusillimonas sp.]